MYINFIVKVEDANLPDIQKALKVANIKVRSIIEIYKEKTPEKKENQSDTREG